MFIAIAICFVAVVNPCNETQIECNGQCIVQSQLCDDVDDCGDNSDEANCGKPLLLVATI